ncbi:Hypothetical protein SMAX5B_002221 [Scophthalmus maximus]|uniref:Uncharacterized protein n=1 Tax=Scophthalmus maximus TaxID=52904 RepID=A0A2U9BFQ9_SCOMX|nr:Hypothetical protein SMAX5B_002221 [Scophthalmus maximus]
MPSRLHIHTPRIRNILSIRSTHRLPHSTPMPSSHNHSTRTLLTNNTLSSTLSSTLSTLNRLPSTNSTHVPLSPNTLTNSTPSTNHSTHMDMPLCSTLTLSTHMVQPNKDHTPSIRTRSTRSTHSTRSILNTHNTRSTHTTPSIRATRRPIIVVDKPEDPHMLVTAPPRTREEEGVGGDAGHVGRLTAGQVTCDLFM